MIVCPEPKKRNRYPAPVWDCAPPVSWDKFYPAFPNSERFCVASAITQIIKNCKVLVEQGFQSHEILNLELLVKITPKQLWRLQRMKSGDSSAS